MNKDKRAKNVKRAIRLAYGSLKTHLWYVHKGSDEGRKFHKECVREYAEQIKLLSKLF